MKKFYLLGACLLAGLSAMAQASSGIDPQTSTPRFVRVMISFSMLPVDG